MSADLTKFTAALAANTTATNAAVAAFKASSDPAVQTAIDAATAQMETNTANLTAAMPPIVT